MRKKYEQPPMFTRMNWWDKLFWHICYHCKEWFKKEDGWKTGQFSHQGGGFTRIYACKKCCPDPEYAEKEYKRRRKNYQTLKAVLS